MKKFLKIFVVCLCLVSLLAVNCFATSAQTTGVVYGYYVSPGDYVFDEVLSSLPSPFSVDFNFISDNTEYTGIYSGPNNSYVFSYVVGDEQSLITVYTSSGWRGSFRNITVLNGFYIYNINDFQWWQSNVSRVSSGYESNLFDGFLSVFTMLGQWISGAFNSLTSIFWVDGSLTFLGVLCIASLAMAVSFLLIAFISRFLRFRG